MQQQVVQLDGAHRVAVIGTAGRDCTRPMTRALWEGMVADVRCRVRDADVLVSGGAAWADHLAVHAFLNGWCAGLELYLPAPLVQTNEGGWEFAGGPRTAGAAANLYHRQFTSQTGVDGRAEIAAAIQRGARKSEEPVSPGYGAMFARNRKVARAGGAVIAYTWGEANHPAQGGTLDTWRQMNTAQKVHVSLSQLAAARSRGQHPAA